MKVHTMVIYDNNQDRLKNAQFQLLGYHNIQTMAGWNELKANLQSQTMVDGRQRIICAGGSKQVRYSRAGQRRLWNVRKSHGSNKPYAWGENLVAIDYQLRRKNAK